MFEIIMNGYNALGRTFLSHNIILSISFIQNEQQQAIGFGMLFFPLLEQLKG